jgi:hypothetical protein
MHSNYKAPSPRRYALRVEARPDGAIGAFDTDRDYTSEAQTRDEASFAAIAQCRADGFESGRVLACFLLPAA